MAFSSSSSSSASASSLKKRQQIDDQHIVLKKLKRGHEATNHLSYLLGTKATWDDGSTKETSFKLLQGIRESIEVGLFSLPSTKNTTSRECKERQRVEIHREVLVANPYDDGYEWRKYGEKEIKNEQFHRLYYRCSYKCGATKKVQQICEYPPTFKVIYKKLHICKPNTISRPAQAVPVARSPPHSRNGPAMISFQQSIGSSIQPKNQQCEAFTPFITSKHDDTPWSHICSSIFSPTVSNSLLENKWHYGLYAEDPLDLAAWDYVDSDVIM